MNRFSLLLNLSFLLATSGVFLLCFSIFSGSMEVVVRLWQRVFSSWAVNKLQVLGMMRKEEKDFHLQVDWRRMMIVIAMPILAVAVHDFLLSPLVVLFGGLLFFWLRYQASQTDRSRINEDAEIASLQLRSLMEVDHSLLNAIKGIDLPQGAMKGAFAELADRLQIRQPPDQAVQSLRTLPGKVTARLAALIASSAHITEDVQASLLIGLEQEAHRQKLLRSKIRQTLALVRGTIRLLQGVAAAAMGFVLLSPTWRIFFLQDVSHRTLLTSLLVCAMLASLYFEYEVHQLGSGEAF
jgi:hypothetical protein